MERWIRWSVPLLPRASRTWVRASLAELPSIPPDERDAWLRGVNRLVPRALAMDVLFVAVLALVAAVLVLADLSTSEMANQVAMLLLLVFAAALGALRPRLAWLTALVIGSVIAVERIVGLLQGHMPSEPHAPHTVAAAATLFVLLVPASLAALLGAAGRRLVSRPPG
jgi:hypothetical protein